MFPVADGDTGDNMVLTLRAVLTELDRLADASEGRTIDEIGRDEIVASVARAALLGARGNSGVILSQLIRGAAEELDQPARRAGGPGADRRRSGPRRRPGVRLGARPGRGHDPHRRARDGPPRRLRARSHARRAAERRRHRRRAGPRRSRRHRERAGGRPGVGQARPRSAARAARRRGRRRRRLRPDRAAGGDRGGAEGLRAAGARASPRGPRHPPPARLHDLPLLHQLRGHRHGPRAAPVRGRAGEDRRLGARGR